MEPFQEYFGVILQANEANGGAYITVPAGKRAVIEHVSVYAEPPGADYFFVSTLGSTSTFRNACVVAAKSVTGWFVGSHPLRAYAGPGTQCGGVVRRYASGPRISAEFVVAGYYEPVP